MAHVSFHERGNLYCECFVSAEAVEELPGGSRACKVVTLQVTSMGGGEGKPISR